MSTATQTYVYRVVSNDQFELIQGDPLTSGNEAQRIAAELIDRFDFRNVWIERAPLGEWERLP